ncbi:MAG: hypothetical protein M3Y87_34335 [Myxococcota bacterium]|nr:hypothetical protein [Myxococcota bacterium]
MASRTELEATIDRFVDEQRAQCLWFLRADWYPSNDEERRRVLEQIQRHADRATFVRAAELKRWLSPRSSDTSAARSA